MKEKYLQLLEELIIIHNQDEKDKLLNDLYIIIHLARWECDNPHLDWQEYTDKKFKHLINNK